MEVLPDKVRDMMVDYKECKRPVINMFNDRGIDRTMEMCVCSMIPYIAAYGFLYDETGDTQYLNQAIRLVKFYGL